MESLCCRTICTRLLYLQTDKIIRKQTTEVITNGNKLREAALEHFLKSKEIH